MPPAARADGDDASRDDGRVGQEAEQAAADVHRRH